jgi:hypothetical protein
MRRGGRWKCPWSPSPDTALLLGAMRQGSVARRRLAKVSAVGAVSTDADRLWVLANAPVAACMAAAVAVRPAAAASPRPPGCDWS